MAAEYSAIAVQSVAVDENVLFNNGCRACRKGFIQHRDDSGIFFRHAPRGACELKLIVVSAHCIVNKSRPAWGV